MGNESSGHRRRKSSNQNIEETQSKQATFSKLPKVSKGKLNQKLNRRKPAHVFEASPTQKKIDSQVAAHQKKVKDIHKCGSNSKSFGSKVSGADPNHDDSSSSDMDSFIHEKYPDEVIEHVNVNPDALAKARKLRKDPNVVEQMYKKNLKKLQTDDEELMKATHLFAVKEAE